MSTLRCSVLAATTEVSSPCVLVTPTGMNEFELKKNPQLDEFVVKVCESLYVHVWVCHGGG
jgi:hypothetical protein